MSAATTAAAESVALELIELERRANDGWIAGDPNPNLAILAGDITYMDSGNSERLDGIGPVRAYFEAYRGKPFLDSYEIVQPRAQLGADVAVLTYRLLIRKGTDVVPFHCTQVYQRRIETGWRVIHSHFSRAKQA